MILIEVFLTPDGQRDGVLSEEVRTDTGAQLFSPEEAAMVGLEGVPDDPENRRRLLLACKPADKHFIVSRLEGSAAVSNFRIHDKGS